MEVIGVFQRVLIGVRDLLVDQGSIELMKIDKNGKIVWENIYDPYMDSDDCGSVLITKDGGYILAGGVNGSNGATYILKLDSARQQQWYIEGDYSASASKIIETMDGRYVFTGYHCYLNNCNITIAKVDTTNDGSGQGVLLWQREYGDDYDNYGYDIQQTSDSGFIISGRWDTVGGAADVLLMKTNCLGFTGPPEAKFNTIINNNIVSFTNTSDSAGDFRWYFGDGDSSVYENPWIIRTNYKGEVALIDTFIHTYKDTGTYIVTLYAGACGEWDTVSYTVEIDSVITGMQNAELRMKNEIKVYPNPANDKLNIKIQNGESGVFEMFDVTGRMILQSEIRNPKFAISIIHLASGIYIYKFTDKEGRMARGKIIKSAK